MSLALTAALPAQAAAHAPVHSVGPWWSLPLMLALAIALHAAIGRSLKAVVASSRPLASGSPEVGGYERTVYGTADRAMQEIVGLVLASGVLMWLGAMLGWGVIFLLAAAVLVTALALDLRRWERVTVSADSLWFQRGLGQKVYQVAIDNIRDVSITEANAGGFDFTLRHGRRNSLCRLNLRMLDKRIVALPKTDARHGLDQVETVANHVRTRQQLATERREQPSAKHRLDAPDTLPASRIRHMNTRT
jgi:hypothetical protein